LTDFEQNRPKPDDLPERTRENSRALIAARPWLRVSRLPSYAPELNPTEKIWSNLKRSPANLAVRTATALERTVKTRLKRMQYRHSLIDGYLAATGLSPPKPRP
jgi:transposase